jgi:methylphosphotriester-DNA--protein-cysteine methyltransferase
MTDDRADGNRLARTVADSFADAERFDALAVDDEGAVEPTADGAFAYAVESGETRLAEAFVHPDRAHVEFHAAPDEAATAATEAGLRVRPKAVRPPQTIVSVESQSDVEQALDVVAPVAEATA